jgi:hypothetical protein
MSRDYDEKRSFQRLNVSCDIELTVPDTGEKLVATCRDLSGGGVLFFSDKAFMADDELDMLMEGNMGRPPLRARLRVIRCDTEGDGYRVATHIEQLLT